MNVSHVSRRGQAALCCRRLTICVGLMVLMYFAGHAPAASPAASAPATTQPESMREALTLDLGGGVCLPLVRVPAGEFKLGSPPRLAASQPNEGPQRLATISSAFYMSVTEVTQAQYRQVMGRKQDRAIANHPAYHVSWTDAQEFCRRLSESSGRAVRLPTEVQWEYACRAGSTTSFSFGDDEAMLDDYGWHRGNSGPEPHPVGAKKPNAWGLYDMHGNVYEWCRSIYRKDYSDLSAPEHAEVEAWRRLRVLRGGSCIHEAKNCRSAKRASGIEYGASKWIGFRVVVELE